MNVTRAVTIRRPAAEIYAFWREFENLPRFMYHLEHVEHVDENRTHWIARAPGGTVEWDAEIVDDIPNEQISWRTVGHDDDLRHSGSVSFEPAPGDRGTEVHVVVRYDPPGGKLGAMFAKLFGEEPGQQIADDLRRLKQVLETGEVLASDASPAGIGDGIKRQRPAQPLETEASTRAIL